MRLQPQSDMASRTVFLLFFVNLFVSWVSAAPLTSERVLAVIEEQSDSAKYSQFLAGLKGRGFDVKLESVKKDTLALFKHGEKVWDHVILFPPKFKGYGPALTPQQLLEFTKLGGNVLILTSPSSIPEQIRELARELDIGLPPKDYIAVDHFNYDTVSNSEKHDVVLANRPAVSPAVHNYFSGKQDDLIAFRGAGHTLGNGPLLVPILTASRTAYAYDSKEDFAYAQDPWAAGTQMQFVSAMQARNNARITLVGSADMFSDEFFDMKVQKPGSTESQKTANKEFCKDVAAWTFGEKGIVKVNAIRHYLSNEPNAPVNPNMYRVKNDVTFEIELSEYDVDRWVPFKVPSGDSLQLEFTMLDPYYRVPLLPASTSPNYTTYTTSFKIPDQHGVFAFRVNYKRPYITYVDEKYSVTVRHFAHDEYTRSWDISGAWVWIAGIAVTITGWIGFCALWLWSAPAAARVGLKKTE
ncbi:Dolichyl-diphosphooligosaccharide-protein glycosyltransferase 48kDa subunit [Tuber magnatum]|uniref:Dolichyl-diphosphooligosaccharide--protein glycosyltransferase subunit WBP1 n=1 Tax=Tuber magnatum TaxID=42249 RepID=A0A317SVG5_9PEZI|nr:Dolichyl-diphosphooligosaccharide-protein glycosyltransferase 48kDa subunit [Tuber magnatum]